MHQNFTAARHRHSALASLQKQRLEQLLVVCDESLPMIRRQTSPTRIGRGVSEEGLRKNTRRDCVIQSALAGRHPLVAVDTIPARPRKSRAVTLRRLVSNAESKCSGRIPDGPAPASGLKCTPWSAFFRSSPTLTLDQSLASWSAAGTSRWVATA